MTTIESEIAYGDKQDLRSIARSALAGLVNPASGKSFTAYAEHFGYTPVVDPNARTVDANSPFRADQETGGASLEADWSLPKVVLTSITGWRFWNWWPQNDSDNSPISVLTAAQNGDYENQLSQEYKISIVHVDGSNSQSFSDSGAVH